MRRPAQVVTVETGTIVRILLLITAFVVSIWLIMVLHQELVWIGVAFFLAVALDPAVVWIGKVLKCSRLVATSIVFVLFIAFLSVLGAVFVPPLISQSEQLVNQFPRFLQEAQDSHTHLGQFVQHYQLVARAKEVQSHLLNDITYGTDTAIGIIRGAFYGFTATITTLVLTFFMLMEAPRWVRRGWSYIPDEEASHMHRLASKMYQVVAGYVNGNLIIAVLAAVLTSIIMAILGVPYAIPLGIWAGLTTLIPIIGGILGLVSICAVAILTTSTSAAIILAIYFTLYIFVDSHFLRPYIYGKTIDMSPLVVMIAIVLGTALDGIIGALVAIPVAACLGILVSDLIGRDEARIGAHRPKHAKAD